MDRTPHLKLIVLDLDGTSVGKDAGVSPRLKAAILRAQREDVGVMLATGRMVTSAVPYWREFGLAAGPLIAYNGAKVVSLPENRIWFVHKLEPSVARLVAEAAMAQDILTQIYINEELWASREDERVRHYVTRNRIPAWVRGVNEILDWPEPPIKILFQAEPVQLDRFRAAIAPQIQGQPVHLVKSQPDYLELMASGVGKGVALAQVAERLGISPATVMAVGDAENDIDMLRWAGVGVAMGQSPKDVRAAANFVTATLAEDGAARAMEYLLWGGSAPWI